MELIQLQLGVIKNNCYILSGDGKNAIIIDPSCKYPVIKEALAAAGLSAAHVLLTHGHFDHIGAARQLQDDGATVWLHPNDFDKIDSGSVAVRTFAPDCELFDGQRLSLCGIELSVIHTAGHTSGSVCFLCDDMLFSGDTLFCGGVGRTDLPSGDYGQLRDSIKGKLFCLPDDTRVLTGHEEHTTIGAERKRLVL